MAFSGLFGRGTILRAACLVALAAIGVASDARAAAPPPGPANHIAPAARIAAAEAPSIDGDLSDPAWARATVIDQFYQFNPNPGDPATERTVLRIMYDENNLYFGVHAYQDPQTILVRAMARDGPLYIGDTVRVMLDPGASRRNGYAFQVGASGGRRDIFLQNNSSQLVQWDTIWQARVRLVADGWVTEIAIPFRSIPYDPDQTEWGFEFNRSIRGKNESLRWSSYNPALREQDITQAGTLTGITNGRAGLGLDVDVYGLARIEHDWERDAGPSITGTGGATAFYKITPAFTGTLTFNPDFSDSPLDNRQVNTSRFSLFLAETRDFFLRDAGAFEFGGRNFGPNNGRPFVTRSIGLVSGRPVTITAGGKLSGQYAGFDIGAVSALTAATATASEQVLTAMRVAHSVFEESRLGFIVTHGDPTGRSTNTLGGADFQYRDSNIFPGKIFQSDMYYERSFSSTRGEDDSFGVALNYPNEPWGGELRFKQIGEDFDPRMGFANRIGIRQYNGFGERRTRYRDSFLREMAPNASVEVVTNLDNEIETRDLNLRAFFQSAADDEITIGLNNSFEAIPEPFDLPRNIAVPAGDYEWTNATVNFRSSDARSWAVQGNIACCSFYDGRSVDGNIVLSWRPSEYFELRGEYEGEFIRMTDGAVDIHILSSNAVVNFTPDMQLLMEAQYDNISEDFSFSARYRWEFSPGSELFVAFGQTALIPGRSFDPQASIFSVRLRRIFQF